MPRAALVLVVGAVRLLPAGSSCVRPMGQPGQRRRPGPLRLPLLAADTGYRIREGARAPTPLAGFPTRKPNTR